MTTRDKLDARAAARASAAELAQVASEAVALDGD
jgi:hypothetical protein